MKQIKNAYILNLCIACLVFFSVGWMFSGLRLPGTVQALSSSHMSIFKFFTVDSNVLMGIVAVIVAFHLKQVLDGKKEALSKLDYLLIHAGTTGVTLTMIVTLFYLAPTIENGWIVCFNNSNFFLHLINPLLSIITYICFEKTNKLSFKDSIFGLIPMCIYSVFYIAVAVIHSENGFVLPGYDFYGFFILGLVSGFVVLPVLVLLTFVISSALYEGNHIKASFNDAVTNEYDLLALLKSQQGELDAVLMYQKIAEKIDAPEIKKMILETAADEGHHGAVFFNLTGVSLRPKKLKSIVVPCLMSVLGYSNTFKIVANQEYAAETKYDEIVGKYPTVVSVQRDEHIHGDRMMEISKYYSRE